MTTRPCPACAEWRESGERTMEINRELVHRATVAEARATAAGADASAFKAQALTALAKLAAAEQREAEKDRRIEQMASEWEGDATSRPDRSERLSLRFCASSLRALASPSTPSPAPSAEEPTP